MKATIFFLVLSLFVSPAIANAFEDNPQTRIVNKSPSSFMYNQLIEVSSIIENNGTIEEVRCYFRYGNENDYVFLQLSLEKDGVYRARLPAISELSSGVEYFILVINEFEQVFRSVPYIMQPDLVSRSIPDEGGEFVLKTEVPNVILDYTLFYDGNTVSVELVDNKRKFGTIAGVYGMERFSDSPVVEGYFGGFYFKEADGDPYPVKGFFLDEKMDSGLYPEQRLKSLDEKAAAPITADDIVGPPISGDDWAGVFFVTYSSVRIPITAVVSQQRDVNTTSIRDFVTITTSLRSLGHYLRGYLYANGSMKLYDQYDGEDWTTYYGPVNSTTLSLADFVRPPTEEEHFPPKNVISLTRDPLPDPPVFLPSAFLPSIFHLLL